MLFKELSKVLKQLLVTIEAEPGSSQSFSLPGGVVDSPLARQDPRLNITDQYLFEDGPNLVLVMNVRTSLAGDPHTDRYHPEARYEFRLNGDLIASWYAPTVRTEWVMIWTGEGNRSEFYDWQVKKSE